VPERLESFLLSGRSTLGLFTLYRMTAEKKDGRVCWAASLGGCHEKISGEHIVSQGLFDENMLMVQGLPWCLDKPKSIGKANLTRNILCKHHNSELSILDAAALQAFNVFRESTKLMNARNGIDARSLTVRRMSINGPLLERWFLKTFINVAIGQPLIIGPGDHKVGTPSLNLVEVVFGRRELQAPAGLYLSGQAGENVVSEDRVGLVTKSEGNNLVASAFNFRGCRFFLSLLPIKFQLDGRATLIYRNSTINVLVWNKRRRQLLSHRIAIQGWK
jgi:hypothetical protein